MTLPHLHDRRLAVVLFADIVGYTALMQQNEQEALVRLGRFKEVLQGRASQFHGQIIQYYGDGCLMLFSSALEAVHFAIGVQDDFRVGTSIPARIGLHAGEVLLRDGFVFGDTVNLASRIESLGIPGSILVSEAVHHQLRNQDSVRLTSLGAFHFKNVEEPMVLYAVSNEPLAVPLVEEMAGKLQHETQDQRRRHSPVQKKTGPVFAMAAGLLLVLAGYFLLKKDTDPWQNPHWENSIAILPFDNLNTDTNQQFMAIGVADEIRNQLASIPSLKVTSRSSSMFFKQHKLPVAQIGESLQATYILDGTVQQTDSLLKISLQLSHAETDKVEWAPVYEKNLDDVFDVQEEIAMEVVQKLKVDLSRREKKQLEKRFSMGTITYDMYFRAIDQIHSFSMETIRSGESFMTGFFQPLHTLPSNSTHQIWLSFLSNPVMWPANVSRDSLRSTASAYIREARTSKTERQRLQVVQAAMLFYLDWDVEAAEKKAREAIRRGDEQGYAVLSDILIRTGRSQESQDLIRHMMELDPLNWEWHYRFGLACLHLDSLGQASQSFERGRRLDSASTRICLGMAATLMHQHQWEAVLDLLNGCHVEQGLRLRVSAYKIVALYASGQHAPAARQLQELRQISEQAPEPDAAFALACAYAGMNLYEEAVTWLQRSHASRENAFLETLAEPLLRSLRSDAGFRESILQTVLGPYLEK